MVTEPTEAARLPETLGYTTLRAAVLHAGGDSWEETCNSLKQSPMLNLEITGVEPGADLDSFDVIYLDESLLSAEPEAIRTAVMTFAEQGGAVFAPNGFSSLFPAEFFGFGSFEKMQGYCREPEYPACTGALQQLQQLLKDFAFLYQSYVDFSWLEEQDYGVGGCNGTARALVNWGELTAYALNSYGDGLVFFCNPLLPGTYSAGSLSMIPGDNQTAFTGTTASFNSLLLSGFAEFVAKEKYGYALERTFGYFGTPAMSWELHYEEITGIANNSLEIFSRLCEENKQVPSFALVRNTYVWFQRAEAVTYLLNQSQTGYQYEMDLYENAYSSGTHVVSDGKWLSLEADLDQGSYFSDYPEFRLRAYPQALDYDGDGSLDIVTGSRSGKVFYYPGTGYRQDHLQTGPRQTVTDLQGQPIDCGSYSAPRFQDIDGDGLADLVCGWNDGKLRWYRGNGTLAFEPMGILVDNEVPSQALPAFGDVNGDGIPDLAVGSGTGVLMLYYGSRDAEGRLTYTHQNAFSLSRLAADSGLGKWLAPAMVDWNGDGLTDLAVGTFDGYVAIVHQEAEGFAFDGYITVSEQNYKGNNNVKFGNWASPTFTDLNGDGRPDLLCGSQEYGMAYPIDSEFFPYTQQLQEQMDYAMEHDYYVGVHFLTGKYASAQREAYELEVHRRAMEAYGLPTDLLGVNHHTWFSSSVGPRQSMESIYDAGFFWESGFDTPGAHVRSPQRAAENVVVLPFFLMEEGEPTLLVHNNSVLLHADKSWYDLTARYGMPVCVYYHCDFAYSNLDKQYDAIAQVEHFRDTYGYNFCREDQMMLASAAALNQSLRQEGNLKTGLTLSLETPGTYPMADEEVYQSLGVRLIPGDGLRAEDFRVDADVWYVRDNELIMGLNRPVTVQLGEQTEEPHLSRINMAARVETTPGGAQIQFLSGGMMEAAVRGKAETISPGWEAVYENGETVFTKFGSGETLTLNFQKS